MRAQAERCKKLNAESLPLFKKSVMQPTFTDGQKPTKNIWERF